MPQNTEFEYNPEIHGKMCPRGTRRKGKMCVPNPSPGPGPGPKPKLMLGELPPADANKPSEAVFGNELDYIVFGKKFEDNANVPAPAPAPTPREIIIPIEKFSSEQEKEPKRAITKKKIMVPITEPIEYNPQIHGKNCPRGTRRKGKMCVPTKKEKSAPEHHAETKVNENVEYKLTPPILTHASTADDEAKKTQPLLLTDANNNNGKVYTPAIGHQPMLEVETANQEPEQISSQSSARSSAESSSAESSSESTPIPTTSKSVEMPLEPLGEQDSNLNTFLKTRERIESQQSIQDHDFLYPDLNDPNFNIKLALNKEFADAQYDGKIYDIEKQANLLCSAKFELSPHQIFVRNFLSSQTPYNGLLLYHGLGTGKTCSAIGVAEEMRQYLKSVGLRDKILVVASPNVQANFRTQLFDDRKLMKYTNVANQNEYTWNIESCVGNTLLQEINPNSIRNLSREKLVSNINSLINESYSFMGYIQLANLITSVIGSSAGAGASTKSKTEEVNNIRQFFDGKLIIIDEVHNIRLSEDNSRKELQQVAALLMRVAKHSVGMRLLLLSATPMFNSYKEIVWITNLLNINDKRSTVQVADIFDSNGNFKEAKNSESGKDVLSRKLTGYVSYVRGENPYTFPFRVYPPSFAPEHVLSRDAYPSLQMNGAKIDSPIEKLQLYINRVNKTTFQSRTYLAMMEYMRKRTNGYYTTKGKYREMPSFENMESFGYIMLQKPIEALNVVYPNESFEKILDMTGPGGENDKAAQWNDTLFEEVVGKNGLANTMTFETMSQGNPLKHHFEYKPEILRKYGRIFSEDNIANYSAKIAEILRIIRQSEGVVLIYSQFIDGGIIPIALALEEMGFTKYTSAPNAKQLFKRRPTAPIDAITLKPIEKGTTASTNAAQYIVITGDKGISAANSDDVKYATSKDNMNGAKVKVVLVSKAGSEGIDFKFIRQVHAFDSWFNMNRLEQVIGRGVRNLSHCALPFKKRNVQIYLHATMINETDEEPADLYLYRLAEKKAVQIGRVSRVIKECAADCVLHIGQTNFTVQKLAELAQNQNITIQLSTLDETTRQPVEIPFHVGDKEGTEMCDYMTCEYQCRPTAEVDKTAANINRTNYSVHNASQNHAYIASRIKELYRENHAYTLNEIVAQINLLNIYPIEQILFMLSKLVNNKSEYLFDKYGRFGYLIRRGKYYVFQPIEIGDERVSVYDRIRPVEWKRDRFAVEIPDSLRRITGPEDSTVDEHRQSSMATGQAAAAATVAEAAAVSAESIVRDIKAKLDLTQRQDILVKSEEKDWYKNASKVMLALKLEYGVNEEKLIKYVVEHAIESLDFKEKFELLKHVFGKTIFNIDPIVETVAANYFGRWKMPARNGFSVGVFLSDKEENHLCVLDMANSGTDENVWRLGDEIDLANFDTSKYNVNKRALNRMIGYIINFKDQDMAFYYKDITLQRNKRGRRCDRSGGKAPIYESLNLLLGKTAYTQENTAGIYGGGLCVISEILMREYQATNKDGKIYLLTPEQAIKSQITNFSVLPNV